MTTAQPLLLFGQADPLLRAVAAYLARYKGLARTHTESDLRIWLCWCAEHRLDPLQAQRAHIELHRRIARGFRNRENYRLRMLLIGGGLTLDPPQV